jgi:hypothetical protein
MSNLGGKLYNNPEKPKEGQDYYGMDEILKKRQITCRIL